MIRPTWPLGTKFRDGKSRTFEVLHVIMGDMLSPEAKIGYEVDCANGWKITSQTGDPAQTQAGFINTGDEDQVMIYRPVEELNEWEQNGHIVRV